LLATERIPEAAMLVVATSPTTVKLPPIFALLATERIPEAATFFVAISPTTLLSFHLR
jgi:hypothetical protein